MANNSLLIVTFDETNLGNFDLRIPTVFFGPMVQAGEYSETINHYNVLRTLEEMYGLPHANNTTTATAITDIWVVPEPTSFGLLLISVSCLIAVGCRRAGPPNHERSS